MSFLLYCAYCDKNTPPAVGGKCSECGLGYPPSASEFAANAAYAMAAIAECAAWPGESYADHIERVFADPLVIGVDVSTRRISMGGSRSGKTAALAEYIRGINGSITTALSRTGEATAIRTDDAMVYVLDGTGQARAMLSANMFDAIANSAHPNLWESLPCEGWSRPRERMRDLYALLRELGYEFFEVQDGRAPFEPGEHLDIQVEPEVRRRQPTYLQHDPTKRVRGKKPGRQRGLGSHKGYRKW